MPPADTTLSTTHVIARTEKAAIAEQEFADKYARYFGHKRMAALRRGRFLVESGAEGGYVFDATGERYLDFFLASGVFNLGHRNPVIHRAMRRAFEETDFGGVFYLSEQKLSLARVLAETTPAGLEIALPANGGGEANDLALKMAMAVTGRRSFICGDASYHGSAGLSSELGPAMLRDWYPGDLIDVHRVPVGDIEALARALDDRIAACIFEPVRYFDALRPGRTYWQEARRLCDENGTLLIIDEVVSGMGRLGELWGSLLDDVAPDMLVTAKGLSGGYYPMAAVVCRPHVLECWGDNPFRSFSTYAWSNVGAAIAQTAIEETRRLLPQARVAAEKLDHALHGLQSLYPNVIERITREGLLYILHFHPDRITGAEFTNEMFRRHVLVHASGAFPNAPGRLMPPLIMNDEHIEEFVTRAESVFSACIR